jgi:hypothetical protein
MAKISKPIRTATKGAPPMEIDASRNLTKAEDTDLMPMNFKVPADFKRTFKTYAAQMDISMVDLLQRCFEYYKDRNI